jgi:acetoin utilization deacetylase AcuC-like enzyme
MAEAIRVVQGLYKDGVLVKPADWTTAPDLLQFYEAKTSVEQDLYVMFMEYRMRAFQGAFHMNPDYMHWYGWAPMKETLQKIKDEAAKLRAEKKIEKALIIDFDLHFGDGTNNIFTNTPVMYFQPDADLREVFMKRLGHKLGEESGYDILAVSAGFDRHVDDWGGELTTEDYRAIGMMTREAAERVCRGRRFAVLEGGYNHSVLGKNVRAFIEGFE